MKYESTNISNKKAASTYNTEHGQVMQLYFCGKLKAIETRIGDWLA